MVWNARTARQFHIKPLGEEETRDDPHRPEATLDSLAKNPAALKRVLLYHVVAGRVTAAQVAKLRSARTLAGPNVRIRVTGKTVRINAAKVATADVMASNGVVHVIDRVLIPPKS